MLDSAFARLLYGHHDRSRPPEREANARDIPGARMRTVAQAGHFLSLDAPEEIIRAVGELTRVDSARKPRPIPT